MHGLNYSQVKASFQASYTDAVDLMKDGHAQAFTLGTTVPASSVMDLASARDIKLIGIDDKIFADMQNKSRDTPKSRSRRTPILSRRNQWT